MITQHTFYEKEDSEKAKVNIPCSVLQQGSTCMSTYRFLFLKPSRAALFLHIGINWGKEIYSPLQWHMYVAEEENIKICQALQGGE